MTGTATATSRGLRIGSLVRDPTLRSYKSRAILDIDEEKNKTLMERWGLGEQVPVTVIVDHGKVVKRFDGYVGWDEIKPHADKAKKNENEQADSDGFWFFRDPWGGSVVDLDRQGRNRRRY